MLADLSAGLILHVRWVTHAEQPMTTTELQSLEGHVLEWIRRAHPVTTTQLLDAHRAEWAGLSGEMLRRAVWNLVDRGLVRYDDDWRVSPTAVER
jgi:hypothetical protein